MDALGLLYAVVSLLVFPGGAYLATLTAVISRAARLPRGSRPAGIEAWVAVAAAGTAAALAPLPGSLAATLPPDRGVAPNLAAAALLLAVGLAAAMPPGWTRRRRVAALCLGAPWLALAVAAASLSLPELAGVPGATLGAARWCAAAAVLVSAPLVIRPFDVAAARAARAALLGAVTMIALAAVLPDAITSRPAPVAAAVVLGGGAGYAALLRLTRRAATVEHPALVLSGIGCAAAATLLALLAGRT